jgi:hypothetical protein
MSSQAEIMIPQGDELLQVRMGRNPETLIKEATLCADALMRVVKKNGWAINFGGKKDHLWFEAWAFLATMYRVTPRVVPGMTKFIEIGGVIGYEAEAEAFHVPSQTIVSTGNAMCLNDEENWGLRPKYEWRGQGNARERVKVGEVAVPLFQLRSMAETRAMSKALKGPFSWVVAMAGFAPNTVEEGPNADGNGDGATKQNIRQPQQKPAQQAGKTSDGAPPKINTNQLKRIFAIAHTAGKSNDEVRAICKFFGFATPDDVTIDKYDQVCAEIEKGDQQ